MQAAYRGVSWFSAQAAPKPTRPAPPSAVAVVRDILSRPDHDLDYLRAKLALDEIVSPTGTAAATAVQLVTMAADVRDMAGPFATPDARIAALRRYLYVSGAWNDRKPFAYDRSDPQGQRIGTKLMATYLATRRGNCVSMPALFLILADRLGLDVAFATAPLHVFVRYRCEDGRVVNLETTSGGHPSRDAWYREQMPMSARAIESGIYLRSLTKREGVALMVTTVMEHLIEQRRYEEAFAVSQAILTHAPHDSYTMTKQGTICGLILEAEFVAKYPDRRLIPPHLLERYAFLCKRNRAMFDAAEALGWEMIA